MLRSRDSNRQQELVSGIRRDDVSAPSLPSFVARLRMLCSYRIFTQCSRLTVDNKSDGPVISSHPKRGMLAIGVEVLIVGYFLLVICFSVSIFFSVPYEEYQWQEAKEVMVELFKAMLVPPFFFLFRPRRYELYSDGTLSVVTVLARWNYRHCIGAYKWVRSYPPGVPFRPTIKFAMSEATCILIQRRNESEFHVTISPQNPEAFIVAISRIAAQQEVDMRRPEQNMPHGSDEGIALVAIPV